MAVEIKNEYGKILMNEDLIVAVAGYAVVENYGIVGMSAKKPTEAFIELIKKDNLRKGVRVTAVEPMVIDIDLYIMLEYGVSLPAVAQNVQQSVRYRIEDMIGVRVRNVNIHVEGIRV